MHAYALVKKIAAGGMAEVFLARMKGAGGFEKPVAVKRVLPSLAQDPNFIDMFIREARLTVALQHANVVQVLDLGTAGSQYFMVMEFVDGENLRALQRTSKERSVSIGLKEALYIVQQVSEGLAYAHERTDPQGRPLNIIHRDINPANIMIASSGEVKLADFGIARATDFNSGTQVGTVKGKPGYIAPELLSGSMPDQRSDLFLMGLLLHELLAGKQLFEGANYFQTLKLIASFDVRKLEPLPGIPPPLWSIISRTLAQDPTARYQRARDLAEALRSYLFDFRMKVGPQDIASLFGRVFVDRHSALESTPGGPEYELRLDSAAIAPERPGSGSTHKITPARTPSPTPPTPPPSSSATAVLTTHVAPTKSAGGARRKLGEILLSQGKITQERLQSTLSKQKRIAGRLGDILVAEGAIEEDDLVRALAEQLQHPFVSGTRLREMPVPGPSVLQHLPVAKAERLHVVPLSVAGKELVCAMQEPHNLARVDAVKFAAGMPIRPVLAGERAIRMAIRRFYHGEDANAELGFEQPTVAPQADGLRPFSDRLTGTREQLFGEEDLAQPGARGKADAPEPLPEPLATLNSTIRPTLLVCNDAQSRDAALRLLLRSGVNAAGTDLSNASDALGRGHFEKVLFSSEQLPNAASALAGLKAKFPALEYQQVSSLAEALVGDSTALEVPLRISTRLVEAALGAMGGIGAQATALSRLASNVAERLGASAAGASRASAGASALLLVAATQNKDAFLRPSPESVRATLGREAVELEDVLALCTSGKNPQQGQGTPVAWGVHAALTLLETTGSAAPGPDVGAKALTTLRERGGLPAESLEALASVLSDTLLRRTTGAPVVILFEEGLTSAAIHTRLLADGIRALVARTSTDVERFVAEGAGALVASSKAAGVDLLELTRGLRSSVREQPLPVFLVISPDQPGMFEAGLEAGADVMEHPVNVDVLAAKLRRATAQKGAPHGRAQPDAGG